MSAPRHSRRKSSSRTGWVILALILLLTMAAGCGLMAWGLLTGRISWDVQPASTSDVEVSFPAPSKQAGLTTTTAAPATGTDHYRQSQAPEWSLLLVNSWNPLPDGYEERTEFVDYDDQGNQIDSRAKDALLQMMSDGADYGLWGTLLYRSGEIQQQYFDEEVDAYKAEGYSDSEADAMAATQVVRPGTSEHQTGLAVDILGSGYTSLQEDFDQTEAFAWLQEHCADYGFILRYPEGKEAVTGREYEPWHYRYVGEEYAREIMSRGITLEEFLAEKGW